MLGRRSLVYAAGLLGAGRVPVWAAYTDAQPGVGADCILFGQAAALGGPAALLGRGMRDGLLAAFAEANRGGGVGGRMLDLVSLDDGYEPAQSVAATRRLLEQDQVFALLGAVGTPTCRVTQPLATAAGVPFIGALTGAGFLRDPRLENVVNLRASYAQETETAVGWLAKEFGASRFAVFHQHDTFGLDGLEGVQQALARRGLKPVATGTYQRNTTDVRAAVATIRREQPDAVVMVAAGQPCAEFIQIAHQTRMDAKFACLSFVGTEALARELGASGEGIVLTQVMPFPLDASRMIVRRYQAALRANEANAAFGFTSLEGYMVGRLVTIALGRVTGSPTRQAFLAAFKGTLDMDDVSLVFGPGSNQGSDEVSIAVLQADGSVHQAV